MEYRRTDINPFNSIASILVLVLIFVGLFFVARFVFNLLALVAPVLLILALIFDYRTVIDYGKWLVNLLRKDILKGIIGVALTVFGFPVIAGFLFAKALFRRKVGQIAKNRREQEEGQFVDFEEVESTTYESMELPPIPPEPKAEPRERSSKNDYEDLFD